MACYPNSIVSVHMSGVIEMRQAIISTLIVVCCGCVPSQLAEAGRCFSCENYTGTIRELNKYLNAASTAKPDKNGDEAFHQAVAYFYRGLSKRAALTARMAGMPKDYQESGRFRYRPIPCGNYTSAEILEDYRTSLSKMKMPGVSFHVGMELFLDDKIAEGRTSLLHFIEELQNEDTRGEAARLLWSDESFELCASFAEEMVRATSQGRSMPLDKAKIVSFYRQILYSKSAAHELHNARLLMKQYPVRRFGFLLGCLPKRQSYDYLSRVIECGTDFLILRGTAIGDETVMMQLFDGNGFGEWRHLDDSSEVSLTSRMRFKIFNGRRDLPVEFCIKESDFGNALVAVYSKTRHALYCAVLTKGTWEENPIRQLCRQDESGE